MDGFTGFKTATTEELPEHLLLPASRAHSRYVHELLKLDEIVDVVVPPVLSLKPTAE